MRRSRRRDTAAPVATPAPAPTAPVREVDDLQAFFDSPPGSPVVAPVVQPAPAPIADPPTDTTGSSSGPGRRPTLLVLAALVVGLVVIGSVVFALVSAGRGPGSPRPAAPVTTSDPSTTGPAAPLTAAAAGDLADVDLSAGDDGATAELTTTGVVLERRAVGVTVAYPQLAVSDDGTQSVAHLELAVWNCLADQPPVDPVTADCLRSLPEYADLGSPDLQVARTAEGLRLTGTFATYTRPNGSAPAYTGRSYVVDVQVQGTADGATGTLALGDAGATVVPPSRVED